MRSEALLAATAAVKPDVNLNVNFYLSLVHLISVPFYKSRYEMSY